MECVQEKGTTGHKEAVAVCEQAISPGWWELINHHQGSISITLRDVSQRDWGVFDVLGISIKKK